MPLSCDSFLMLFRLVYFARPDSELDGISVHRSRENMGRKLAKKIKDTLSKEAFDEIDVGKFSPSAPSVHTDGRFSIQILISANLCQ